MKRKPNTTLQSSVEIIAIGASTGGTKAVYELLSQLPLNMPGIVIVQHLPPDYIKRFAERLNLQTKFVVKEAQCGDEILSGHVYLAPDGKQMKVKKFNDSYFLICTKGEKVNGFIPSVGVLFESLAKNVGDRALGVILTGMGQDGAEEIKHMKLKGSFTVGQDEASSVVYGMPKIANDIGGLCQVSSIDQMGLLILDKLEAV